MSERKRGTERKAHKRIIVNDRQEGEEGRDVASVLLLITFLSQTISSINLRLYSFRSLITSHK